MIALERGEMRLELAPERGGAITRLTFRGRDVFRPAGADCSHPLQASCFALAPFANRIAHGRFAHEGRDIRLRPNLAGDPHPLHGQGWLAPWRVSSSDGACASLAYDHPADDWPWAYSARQELDLLDNGLDLKLEVANRDHKPMPLSLGFHPYFLRTPTTRLRASVSSVWLCDASLIPTRRMTRSVLLDFMTDGAMAIAPDLDHCFSGWRGVFRIEQPDMTISVTGSDELGLLHLFTPKGEPFFCAEPVTAMPDAFNRKEPADQTGLRVLPPGGSCSIGMRVIAEPNHRS